MLDSIIGFLTLTSSLVLRCQVDGMCCQLKKKKCYFFFKDSALSSPIRKRKEKKILAQVYIANGHGIDSQVPNSSTYIKVITLT